jgi:hypothetical protein
MTGSRYSGSRLGAILAMVVAGGALASHAGAQDQGPNTGAISLEVTADLYSEYWFRGIPQEDQGVIFQPGLTVTATLVDNDDWSLALYGGTWNSLHSGPSGTGGGISSFYENDWYFGGTVGIGPIWFDASYVVLYGPSAGRIFAEEVDLSAGFDDGDLWGEDFLPGWTGLQPYVLVAIETDGASDAGGATAINEEGVYLELGIEPGFTAIQSASYPVDVSFPVTVGWGLEDYYEHPGVSGTANDDEDFGFVSAGAHASMPLALIPAEFGAWSIGGGVDFIWLNADYIDATMGTDYDAFRIVGSVGITLEY